jgi:hypothetical protein
MKKIILSAGLLLSFFAVKAQTPIIEKVIVEQFHIATANDEANGGPKAGSVTWRIFLDLIPNAEFSFITGDQPDVNRTLKFSTTTKFFNHANGDIFPNFSKANAVAGTIGLDTYLAAGAATNDNYFGVPKTISPDGYILNTGAAFNPPATSPGIDLSSNFKNTPGNSYESSAVSVGPDVPQKGYDPAGQNILLIGQFTTDGEFCFNINVGGRDAGGVPQLLIYSTDVAYDLTEVVIPELMGCPKVTPNTNLLPIATLTAPTPTALVCKDSILTVTATATDADGSVKKVEFFANNVSIGVDTVSPYSVTYKPLAIGNLDLKVIATDDKGGMSKDTAIAKVTVDVKNCIPTGINKIEQAQAAIFPNPVTAGSDIKIQLSNLAGSNVAVSLMDVLGRSILTTQLPVTNGTVDSTLSISDLSTGTYIVLIKTAKEVISKKLILE